MPKSSPSGSCSHGGAAKSHLCFADDFGLCYFRPRRSRLSPFRNAGNGGCMTKARGWLRRFLRHRLSATIGRSQPGRKQTALRAAPAILIFLLPVFGRQQVGRETKEPLIGFSEHLVMSGYGYGYGLA